MRAVRVIQGLLPGSEKKIHFQEGEKKQTEGRRRLLAFMHRAHEDGTRVGRTASWRAYIVLRALAIAVNSSIESVSALRDGLIAAVVNAAVR